MLSYMVNWVVTLQIFDQITHDWFLGKISLWRDKISCILYNRWYKMHTRNFYFSKCIDCVQNTLNNCGFSEYLILQNVPDNCGLAKMIKTALLNNSNRPCIILYLNFLSVLIFNF